MFVGITYYTTPLLEIALIWVVLNYLLKFFWGTGAMDLVFGLLSFLCLFVLAEKLHLPVIRNLMLHVVNIAAIVVFIIFQPEIRLALSRIRLCREKFVINMQDEFIDHLTACIYRMAERQIGALIVLENERLLNDLLNLSAVKINADFSEELLEAIFEPSSHLHDGAVLMRGKTISYARVILPLAHDTTQLSRSHGNASSCSTRC
ncbi:hypothetical membrane spanning protein [Chlamydia trachomatis A/HAR-13]|uniref:Hypothetical membrane spanning protein n=1 Tax=Chlamydia trachomatis serovar A (strain ATCC VR-571B / DSM 19440 / HAR-13) TaxID=315277 RepID=A0A0H2X1L3_CHLTA|nr:hypothetical membrane spanning protein [Chlamydia trachomatis A/HAR-13]